MQFSLWAVVIKALANLCLPAACSPSPLLLCPFIKRPITPSFIRAQPTTLRQMSVSPNGWRKKVIRQELNWFGAFQTQIVICLLLPAVFTAVVRQNNQGVVGGNIFISSRTDDKHSKIEAIQKKMSFEGNEKFAFFSLSWAERPGILIGWCGTLSVF